LDPLIKRPASHLNSQALSSQNHQKPHEENQALIPDFPNASAARFQRSDPSKKQEPAAANSELSPHHSISFAGSRCHSGQGEASGIVAGYSSQAHAASLLRKLAGRVQRLGPCRRDPEAFHVEKSEIKAELLGLALLLSGGGMS
jgi:hypothetical protein